jgi:hypothetical protein
MPLMSEEPAINERGDATTSVIQLDLWPGNWKLAYKAALAGFQPANQRYKLGSFFARGMPGVWE